MMNPKEPGGWGRVTSDQPAGTKDRTFDAREAFPRDVDEGFGRHVRVDRSGSVHRIGRDYLEESHRKAPR
jgi:hypothetical protein